VLIDDKTNEPPSHLQCGSSEDLSFADFSAMEDSIDDCYNSNGLNNSFQSSHNYNNNSDYHHHNNTNDDAFLDTSPNSQQNHRRRSSQNNRKVSAMDVASVGNASDTMVVPDHHHHRYPSSSTSSPHQNPNNSTTTPNNSMMIAVATRDLHEKAKLAFNAANYHEALPLFESILSAQVRRFSSTLHPSVGAAMHNVGVRIVCVCLMNVCSRQYILGLIFYFHSIVFFSFVW
jgi:hypothetical protein